MKKRLSVCLVSLLLLSQLHGGLASGQNTASGRGAVADSTINTVSPARAVSIVSPVKTEVVYGVIGNDGSPGELYIVNSFELPSGGNITDYGNYHSVINLTNNEAIGFLNGHIETYAEAGMFYYQGNTSDTELPWVFGISYYLDGTECSANSIAGKSGKLDAVINISENTKAVPDFFGAYTLQVSVTLNTTICSGIEAPGATIAAAGNNKQLTYTILPGNNASLIFSADVRDFYMDPVSIAGLRSELQIDVSSLDLSSFTGDFSKLNDSIAQLDEGAGQISSRSSDAADAADSISSGLGGLSDGAAVLYEGITQLETGIAGLSGGLSGLSAGANQLTTGAKQLLDTSFQEANIKLASVFAAMGIEDLPVLNTDNYSATIAALSSAYPPAAAQLSELQTYLDASTEFYNNIVIYTAAVNASYEGSVKLLSGAGALSQGISDLNSGTNRLSAGANDLSSGIRTLASSLGDLKSATSQLRDATSDINTIVNEGISSAISGITGGSVFKVRSFVSDKNTNVRAVQFVLRTEGINIPAPVTPPPEPPESLNLWQKFLRLFGWY